MWNWKLAAASFYVALVASNVATTQGQDDIQIMGCGGFIKSPYSLDLEKIEIKLFTGQGSLKLKTECAPTTGYYFIPLENKGSYILKISPPEGWKFEPEQYAIDFDGESDICSKGADVNFNFQGFAIFGYVVTKNFEEGPSAVNIELEGPSDLKMRSMTSDGGKFSFEGMPPGKYILKAAHPDLDFENSHLSVDIVDQNIHLGKQIKVVGYQVEGSVESDKAPVQGVSIMLFPLGQKFLNSKYCKELNKSELPDQFNQIKSSTTKICYEITDSRGRFTFRNVVPGEYKVIPYYKGQGVVYSVTPDELKFSLGHASKYLPTSFEVEGFTVTGMVSKISGASVFVNGILKAITKDDGSYFLAKMKPGKYKLQISAEGLEFDEKDVIISPTAYTIPEILPSRFKICGEVKTSSSMIFPVTIIFISSEAGNNARISKLVRESRFCVFLPQGRFSSFLEKKSQNYFTPEEITVQVPDTDNSNKLIFQEYRGKISGTIDCALKSCGEGASVVLRNKATGFKVTSQATQFEFNDLESGEYSLELQAPEKGGGESKSLYCWEKMFIDDIKLKNKDISGITFKQTGYSAQIYSTHATIIKLIGEKEVLRREINNDEYLQVCLKGNIRNYKIEAESCHNFETVVEGSKVSLISKNQWFSGVMIDSPSKIEDLKVTVRNVMDDEDSAARTVKINENPVDATGKTRYEVLFLEEPQATLEIQIFSYGFIFEPSEFVLTCGLDCEIYKGFSVIAKESHVIKGQLSIPLEGVEIKIELIGDPEATTFVTTDSLGKYIAGPFVHPSGFKVTPRFSGYAFHPRENEPYNFKVSKLAKIKVKISDSLSSVLLSLSGPNGYRQNKLSDNEGQASFENLQPGQYYLKALLKEFAFNPSAMNIDLSPQETKVLNITATRESFSIYGQLSSLSGEVMPEYIVSAKGMANCSEYKEDGVSDDFGVFRIWALKSYCTYRLTVVEKPESKVRVQRTIPDHKDIMMSTNDLHNVSIIVITPVKRMDVSLRCLTNNAKIFDHLKVHVYTQSKPDSPIHIVGFKSVSYLILPPIPIDHSNPLTYSISFESTLSRFQYEYMLPDPIEFVADSAYAHFEVSVEVKPASVDQDISKTSYLAFVILVMILVIFANFDGISKMKSVMDNYTYKNYSANSSFSGSGNASNKKNKAKFKAA